MAEFGGGRHPKTFTKSGIGAKRNGIQWSVCAAAFQSRACRLGVKMRKPRNEHMSSGVPSIVLQKSPSSRCEIEICNDRIGARAPLNRCCAFAPDLESTLRDKMLKILLQHNPLDSRHCS